MRTITLGEYRPIRERLTKGELDELLTVRDLVGVSPLPGDGAYELRAGSVVGTIILPSLRLLIRPKVEIENLFYLLGFGAGVARWGEGQFPYRQDPDLFRAVAWIFEAEVRRALAQGMTRGYQPRSETLTTLRGRIDVTAQLRLRQGRPYPLECSFEEYTEDTELNRIVKAAHRRLLQIPGLELRLARRLRHRYRAFDTIASVEYPPGSVPDLTFTRLDRHWQSAGRLARIILRQQSLRDREGTVVGTTFCVDMNALFERFVEEIVREEAHSAGLQLVSQAPRRLTANIRIRPDLILRDGGKDLAVADVKYKELKPGKLPHADLYQMLAYCVSLELPAGLLIYASEGPLVTHMVQSAGVDLRIVGIGTTGTPQNLESRARKAAAELVREAMHQQARYRTAV